MKINKEFILSYIIIFLINHCTILDAPLCTWYNATPTFWLYFYV